MTDTGENWSAYWQDEGSSGEVFVDENGEAHPALASYWKEVFARLKKNSRLLDLACGGGSVFQHLGAGYSHELHGADISAEAIEVLTKRMSAVKGIVCAAIDTPFPDGYFDLVVSQFGIEYAGKDAFAEAARLVTPSGFFAGLCHYRDGAIDSRNALHLESAKEAKDSEFIDLATELIQAVYKADKTQNTSDFTRVAEKFSSAEKTLTRVTESSPDSVGAHLYQGFVQLYGRRHAYLQEDIKRWLDGMRGEVDQAINRLSHMRDAALSSEQTEDIKSMFIQNGFKLVDVQPFTLPDDDQPVAWAVLATKS